VVRPCDWKYLKHGSLVVFTFLTEKEGVAQLTPMLNLPRLPLSKTINNLYFVIHVGTKGEHKSCNLPYECSFVITITFLRLNCIGFLEKNMSVIRNLNLTL